MSETTDPRHVSRAIALQQLFTLQIFSQVVPGAASYPVADLLSELEVEDYDAELSEKIIAGVQGSTGQIDATISKLAPTWPISQIAPVDLLILRIAIWEAFVSKLTPAKVAINEAIELAKEFGGANSASFVNGVLGNLVTDENLKQELVHVD